MPTRLLSDLTVFSYCRQDVPGIIPLNAAFFSLSFFFVCSNSAVFPVVRVMSGVICVQTGENRTVNVFQLSVFDRGFQHSPE